MTRQNTVTLNRTHKGQKVRIAALPEGDARAQFIRLGLSEGEQLLCFERLPGGTVVVQKRRQQIAIGSGLARQIKVVIIDDNGRQA